jgi:hypothetical protein
VLDHVTGHLLCSGDDGIEEALAAGCVQGGSEQARGRGIATIDRGAGQQYLAHQRLAWRQVAQGRCPQVLLDAMVITSRERNPGQQHPAARGGQIAGQLRGGARIAKREAQQRLLLVGAGEQRRTGCRGQDAACGPDGSQRVTDLPAGRPDLRPVQQRQEFEDRPTLFGYGEHSFGKPLRGVEVAAFQREAG